MRFGDDLDVSPWRIALVFATGVVVWWLILSHVPWV